MKALHIIAVILVVIGGLDWGLVGIGGLVGSNWNVIHLVFGAVPWLEWVLYILVGLSAILLIFTHMKDCKKCAAPAPAAPAAKM